MPQAGYENDLANLFNAAGGLANQFSRSQALSDHRTLFDQSQREKSARDFYAEALSKGAEPEDIKGASDTRGLNLAYINSGLPKEQKISPENFGSNGQNATLNASPYERMAGFRDALKAKVDQDTNLFDSKKQSYIKKFSQLPINQLTTIDPKSFGDDAGVADSALGDVFATHSTTAKNQSEMWANRYTVGKQKFADAQSGVVTAKNIYKRGDKDTASVS